VRRAESLDALYQNVQAEPQIVKTVFSFEFSALGDAGRQSLADAQAMTKLKTENCLQAFAVRRLML